MHSSTHSSFNLLLSLLHPCLAREEELWADYLHSFALLNGTREPIPYPIDPIISALLDKEENLGCAKPFGDFAQLL